jgi:capsid assembly protease
VRILRLTAAFVGTPWALRIETLEAFDEMLRRAQFGHHGVEQLSAFDARQPAPRGPAAASRQQQSVAVLQIRGVIAQHASLVSDICPGAGTSTEQLMAAINAAAADPAVRSIVLDIDSPGGSVFGVQELADAIVAARAQKPIAAVANASASSAAYWIASAAHELFVTPSGEVGSIGVYGVHQDTTKADEAAGKTTTLISAGKYKTEGFGPLTDDARAHMQERIDGYYTQFVKAIAKNRGVPVDAVRSGYGQGRTLSAEPALAAGMVDGIATLDQVIARYARRTVETANKGATSAGSSVSSLYAMKVKVAAAAIAPIPQSYYAGTPLADQARAAIEKAAARSK